MNWVGILHLFTHNNYDFSYIQTFNEVPPPYHGKHPSDEYYDDDDEEDNESLIDLNFEEVISQPYLSLGLTPISQLSPDPMGSSGTDFGFFPSMLPPVSPITSVMNATGISVDPDDSPPHQHLVMPDAMLNSYNLAPMDSRRKKQSRQDNRMGGTNGQFYGNGVLETLVEHRSLEVDDVTNNISGFSKGTSNSHETRGNRTNLITTSMSSSEEEEEGLFVFPSADTDSPLAPRKRTKVHRSKRQKPPLDFDEDFTDMYYGRGTALSRMKQNGSTGYGNLPGVSYMDPNFGLDIEPISPNHQFTDRRQQARDRAKAEQKALLIERKKEEDLRKFKNSKLRHDQIAKDYSTFTDHKTAPRGSVLQQIARFDAEVEIQHEENSDKRQKSEDLLTSPSSSRFAENILISPKHSWSMRSRNQSNNSIDMEVTDDQVTAL